MNGVQKSARVIALLDQNEAHVGIQIKPMNRWTNGLIVYRFAPAAVDPISHRNTVTLLRCVRERGLTCFTCPGYNTTRQMVLVFEERIEREVGREAQRGK